MHRLFEFSKGLFTAYLEDDGFTKGDALADSTTFSLAPILVTVISVAGWVFGEQAIRKEVYEQVAGILGAETAQSIQRVVQASYKSGDTAWVSILGVGILIFGATGAFHQLKLSLDSTWQLESNPKIKMESWAFSKPGLRPLRWSWAWVLSS